jgi:hypothetical protein
MTTEIGDHLQPSLKNKAKQTRHTREKLGDMRSQELEIAIANK